MAFRFVRQKGSMTATPVFITVYGSGTIPRGSVVEFSRINNRVEPASKNTTYTTIFGISLDYIEGATQDALATKIRVIPFIPGQLWEADTAAAASTAMLFIKQRLSDRNTLDNSITDINTASGIFISYMISPNATNKVIGEFIRSSVGWGGASSGSGYF